MFYSLIFDPATGMCTGCHTYVEEPTSYPANEVSCTQVQSQIPNLWMVTSGGLVASLPAAQAAQTTAVTASCASAITSGFASSALGAANTYPSDVISQSNIDRAASISGGSLWCAPASGVWALTPHTMAQATQVQTDLWQHIQLNQTKLASLLSQINAATTVAAAQAITW
jgi:hypothetical protein